MTTADAWRWIESRDPVRIAAAVDLPAAQLRRWLQEEETYREEERRG